MMLGQIARVEDGVLDGRVSAAQVIANGVRRMGPDGQGQSGAVAASGTGTRASEEQVRAALEELTQGARLGFGQEKLAMIAETAQSGDVRARALELWVEAEANAEQRGRANKRRMAAWANTLGRQRGEGPTFIVVLREAGREPGEAAYLQVAPATSGGVRFVFVEGLGRDSWPPEFSELPRRCRIWRWRGGAGRGVEGLSEEQAALFRRIGRGLEYGWQINEANARLRALQTTELEAGESEKVEGGVQAAAGEVDVRNEEIIEAAGTECGEEQEDVAGETTVQVEAVAGWTPLIEVEGIDVDEGRLNQWRNVVDLGLTPIAKDLGIRQVKLVIAEEDDHCDILVFWKMGEEEQESAVSVPINGVGSRREALELIRKGLGERVQ